MEHFFSLPIELQDIILSYTGIYYPKSLEQGLFAYNEKKGFRYIDQIMTIDNIESLKLLCDIYHLMFEIVDDDDYNEYLEDLRSVCIKQGNIDFLVYVYTRYRRYYNYELPSNIDIVNCVGHEHIPVLKFLIENHDLVEQISLECVKFNNFDLLVALSKYSDEIPLILYKVMDNPIFRDYLFSIAKHDHKMLAMYNSVINSNIDNFLYLAESEVIPDWAVMRTALTISPQMVKLVHRYLPSSDKIQNL